MKKYILTLALALPFIGTTQLKAMSLDEFVKETVNDWGTRNARVIHTEKEKICKFNNLFESAMQHANHSGSRTVELPLDEYGNGVQKFTVDNAHRFYDKFKELYAEELKKEVQ